MQGGARNDSMKPISILIMYGQVSQPLIGWESTKVLWRVVYRLRASAATETRTGDRGKQLRGCIHHHTLIFEHD